MREITEVRTCNKYKGIVFFISKTAKKMNFKEGKYSKIKILRCTKRFWEQKGDILEKESKL